MSCITKGRTEPCRNNIGGVRKVYLFPFVKYSYSQIVGTRGVDITSFPVNTTVYEYDTTNATFNESINNDENGLFYDQTLTFTLLKQDLATTKELDRAQQIDLSYIVEYNDGSLRVGGLWNGARITNITINSGGGKGDFNGYNVTISGKEIYLAAYISSTEIITGSAVTLLTDIYPTGLGGAWSVYRKLRGDYGGNAFRVRRSSDNSELDIGFSGDFVNTTALTAFVGASSGYVTTIYDQSVNGYDFTQTNTAKQGRIVNAGTIETQNSVIALYFDGTDDFYSAGDVLSAPPDFTIAAVMRVDEGSTYNVFNKGLGAAGSREYSLSHLGCTVFDEDTNANQSAVTVAGTTENAQILKMAYFVGSSVVGYSENGAAFTTAALAFEIIDYPANLVLYSNPSGSVTYEGYLQEIVMWQNDYSSELSGITTNINTDYTIY